MNELDILSNSNKNLDALALQIQRAKMSGEQVMVDYFEEIYSLQTAWLIVMYSILACAVVTIVMSRPRDDCTSS